MHVDNISAPQYLEVCIKASKIDALHLGVTLYLRVMGEAVLCPIAVILHYMAECGGVPGLFFIFAK